MAVMQNSIIFGGVDSADFGIYIGGEGTFDAPKRDVEMISIPGRNGAFALDKGRFENIEVTYSAFNHEPDLATFSAQLEGFRNAICSQKGYQRLTDTFHPDEYRMAAYIDGLEIKPVNFNTASTFDIVFDCKPQRFLTSGEEPITIGEWHETETASGSTASFEAKDGDAVKSLVVDIEPTQSGSGTPSPTNVRPISGYDSVVVSRCGKNICPNTGNTTTTNGITFTRQSDGSYVANGTATARVTFYFPTSGTAQTFDIASSQYILNGCPHGGSNDTYSIVAYLYKDGSYTGTSRTDIGNSITIDATNANGLRVAIDIKSGTTVNSLVFKPMMRLASETDATYEPYQGTTYTTALNGTRYGGSLNMSTGVLTVDRGFVTFDGSENWSKSSLTACDIFILNKGDADFSQIAILSAFEYQATQNVNVIGKSWLGSSNTQIRVGFSAHGTTTLADFKTWLGSNNVQLCYTLATPTTVQLTAQEVELLVGLNQVWANSGDVTVEYGTRPSAVYNPTLFEASPMLEVEGHGNIAINDDIVTIASVPIGWTVVSSRESLDASSGSCTFAFDDSLANNGDDIRFNGGGRFSNVDLRVHAQVSGRAAGAINMNATGSIEGSWSYVTGGATTDIEFGAYFPYASFDYGTQKTLSGTVTFTINFADNTSKAATLNISLAYSGTNTFVLGWSLTSSDGVTASTAAVKAYPIELNSTKSALGDPLYIDLDIGEAYKIEDGSAVSVNNAVTIPAKLPTLKPGVTDFELSSSITDLKVIPRWWKI